MKREEPTGLFAGLVFVGSLMGLLGPTDLPAAEGSSAASAGAKSSGASTVLRLRNMVYARNTSVLDDETWVEGGAEGSSILLIQNRIANKSHWVLLRGRHMFLRLPGDLGSTEVITDTPGEFVTSEAGDWDKNTKAEYNKRVLTNDLRSFYRAYGVWHVPFLMGKGWDGDQGATWAQARPILKDMNLRYSIMTSSIEGCVTAQVPEGGMPATAGTTVQLWFDGVAKGVPPLVGDTHETPLPVDDNGNDFQELVHGKISEDNTDAEASPSCDPGGLDIFWAVPPTAKGGRMKATLNSMGPRVTLSAWVCENIDDTCEKIVTLGCPDCCAFGRVPSIEFDVHSDRQSYIVVDLSPQELRDPFEWISIDLDWTSPQGRQEQQQAR